MQLEQQVQLDLQEAREQLERWEVQVALVHLVFKEPLELPVLQDCREQLEDLGLQEALDQWVMLDLAVQLELRDHRVQAVHQVRLDQQGLLVQQARLAELEQQDQRVALELLDWLGRLERLEHLDHVGQLAALDLVAFLVLLVIPEPLVRPVLQASLVQ